MTRVEQVLAAIRAGHDTAPKMALAIGVSRDRVSGVLQRMLDRGLVERAGTDGTVSGRPATVWKLSEVVVPSPKSSALFYKPQPQRVTPPAQVTASAKRALDNAPPEKTKRPLFPPAPKDTRNEIADTRRPTNELQGRLLNESLRGVTSFRPDPPAEQRGAVVIPLEGERPPGRLRTDQIDALEGRR